MNTELNPAQTLTVNRLIVDREKMPAQFPSNEYSILENGSILTAGNYKIRPDSVCILFAGEPNPIEIFATHNGRKVGALPTISTYPEYNNEPDSLAYPSRTTYDALLFAKMRYNKRSGGIAVPQTIAATPKVESPQERVDRLQAESTKLQAELQDAAKQLADSDAAMLAAIAKRNPQLLAQANTAHNSDANPSGKAQESKPSKKAAHVVPASA